MNSLKAKRIEYLDTVRAYLIFLVILGHVLIVLNPEYDRLILTAMQEFIASFHMPAFFIIHGILLKNTHRKNVPPRKTVVGRRAKTLLMPYLLFELLGIACRWILHGQPLITGLYNMVTVRCNVGADWFLPALLIGSLLTSQIGIRLKTYLQILSIGISVIIIMLLPESQFFTVLGRGLLGYTFIMIGYLLRNFFSFRFAPKISNILAALILTALCSVINMKWGGNDFYSRSIQNPITLIIAGISGTYLILSLAARLSWPLTQKIGTQTLIIMGTHQLPIYTITAFFPAVTGGHFLLGCAILAGILLFEIPVVYLLKRYCSFFLGYNKKQE